MELFSGQFVWGLLSIVMIDLVLAGDNAIVIGMAARNVPDKHRKAAIWLGMAGAILVRIAATTGVVYLLNVPGLMLVGGLLLVWIAYKLLVDDGNKHSIEAKDSLIAAVRTIVIADAVMGLDNVLGVAGAAHGNLLLVGLGLAISIPIIIWGSTFFMKCIDRFPSFMYVGSGILAYTAAKMITAEPMLSAWLFVYPLIDWALIVATVVGVLAVGWLKSRSFEDIPDVIQAGTVRIEK